MRNQFVYILYFFLISLNSGAQNRPTQTPDLFKHHSPLYFSPNLIITQTQPAPGSVPLLKHVYTPAIKPISISDMPFFCAMECKLRGRTGIWIKFRTGDDASYEKLIHSGEK